MTISTVLISTMPISTYHCYMSCRNSLILKPVCACLHPANLYQSPPFQSPLTSATCLIVKPVCACLHHANLHLPLLHVMYRQSHLQAGLYRAPSCQSPLTIATDSSSSQSVSVSTMPISTYLCYTSCTACHILEPVCASHRLHPHTSNTPGLVM